MLFLKILLNSRENTCVGTLLKRDIDTGVFLLILQHFKEHLSYRSPLVTASLLAKHSGKEVVHQEQNTFYLSIFAKIMIRIILIINIK